MICQRCGKNTDGIHTCSPVRFTVGNYEMYRATEGRVWIGVKGDGEGGEFDEAAFAAALRKFYEENF
jgi:hypothetical protein